MKIWATCGRLILPEIGLNCAAVVQYVRISRADLETVRLLVDEAKMEHEGFHSL